MQYEPSRNLNRQTLFLIQSIKEYKNLHENIKHIEQSITRRRFSNYNREKLSKEKADYITQKNAIVGSVNILKSYKSNTIKHVRPFIKTGYSLKTNKRIIRILRQLLHCEQQAKHARDVLVSCNQRLVVAIAKKPYDSKTTHQFSDLIQEGNIGLIKAIDKFDYRLGHRLSTYAIWWIRQSIIRAIEDKTTIIRMPIYVIEKIKKMQKKSEKLISRLRRSSIVPLQMNRYV